VLTGEWTADSFGDPNKQAHPVVNRSLSCAYRYWALGGRLNWTLLDSLILTTLGSVLIARLQERGANDAGMRRSVRAIWKGNRPVMERNARIELGGVPEQGVADGKGMLYVVMQDAVGSVTAVDVKAMKATGHYSFVDKGGCNGLALDVKNQVLFAACGRSGNRRRNPRSR
jgi:hypothetical protein